MSLVLCVLFFFFLLFCFFFLFFLIIRRPPRSTLDRSSAASDVYKRQVEELPEGFRRVVARYGFMEQPDIPRLLDERHLEAVSYTHLRAHETVLDLVCRLLLEKNKEHMYSYNCL